MPHRPRYYLAKSADSGKCGNKPGLPSTLVYHSHTDVLKWQPP